TGNADGQPVSSTQMRGGGSDSLATMGVISDIEWSEDGKTLTFINRGRKVTFDLENEKVGAVQALTKEEKKKLRDERRNRYRRRYMGEDSDDPRIKRPARGRQYKVEKSPDKKWYAVCEDWNVVLEDIETGKIRPVTTSGTRKYRYGTANWMYGEELPVRHGMWWTPDSKKLIYYVFDERPVQDYYLAGNLTEVVTSNLVEGYTKAGDPNPVVSLEIYDLETGIRTPVETGDMKYIFLMRFTPDGREFLFNRTDRHQRHLDVVALDTETLSTRVVVTETQQTWQDNAPLMQFLEDGKRFIWETEKNGFKQYELRHLDGRLLNGLSRGDYPAAGIVKVDEKTGYLYYMAASDRKNPLCLQVHRVKLNGKDQKKLTAKPLNHGNASVSSDGKWLTVQYENVATPPSTALYTTDGKQAAVLARGPDVKNDRSELFTFKSADGKWDLYGILHKPADFDPDKKYPLIVSVYGGPASRAIYQRFRRGHAYTARGYLVAQIDNRGTSGRGKDFKNAGYGKLGDVDIQDQADGVKFLRQRSYVDGSRIGIVGHSYGGYMAAMGILKHPDVFNVAVDRAGPTWWRNYDSIYTERYMSLPQDNEDGYENGKAMNYVKNLKGQLLIMHGLVDDNVHPNNAFQLIDALNQEKKFKHYETRFFPKGTHGFSGTDMQWDFFDRHLKPEKVSE
ncbi:hypothetical protein BVY01_04880, partial [bacterium I07]